MRRSTRTQPNSAISSALADLAKRKASGNVSRVADYELHQEAAIYETVDEETYAAIAAQKRKEARDFIDTDLPDGDDGDGFDDDDLEREFEADDKLSLVTASLRESRKRKRPVHRGKRTVAPTQRVSSAFFNAFQSAAPAALEEHEDAKPVFDANLLGEELAQSHVKMKRAARKRKKYAVQKAVGNMLFDTPLQQARDVGAILADRGEVAQQEEFAQEYEAPPPSLGKPPLPKKKADVMRNFVQEAYLEDSMDADALVAVADAAVKHRGEAKNQGPQKNAPSKIERQNVVPVPAPVHTMPAAAANAPLARDANGDLLMYWTDAHEVRVSGGQHLYLFGKAPVGSLDSNVFASVCVQVRGMERTMFILPRKNKLDAAGRETSEEVKIVPDVYGEVSAQLLGKAGSRGLPRASNLPSAVLAKKVVRACPFGDMDAPREPTDYLKVKIPFENMNALLPESSGKTYSRVFGSKASASEQLCLKRKLKGPAWVRITNATNLQTRISHAKYAFTVPSPKDITVDMEWANRDPPSLSVLCINIKTMLNNRTGAHEVVMLAGVFLRQVPLSGPVHDGALEPGGPMGTRDFVLVRPLDGQSIPFGFADRARSTVAREGGVEVVANEPALLNNFLTKLLRLDPDVLLGHDLMGFGLDVLISRMKERRCREWSRLGRLVQRRDLSQVVKNNSSASWFKSEAVAGRLVVDTYLHAKELLFREKDYSLSALSQNVLSAQGAPALPPSMDVSRIPHAYESAISLCRLRSESVLEARTAGKLAAHLSILPLTRQLTTISGNIWSHTLRGARAERIEYLLSHEFRLIGSKNAGDWGTAGDVTAKLLLPDKLTKTERAKRAEIQERQAARLANNGGGNPELTPDAKPGAQSAKGKSTRRKPQYSGGLVLDPKRGFYDRYVLQLDFNSLYPSIIQEFNICFTTLKLAQHTNTQAEDGPSSPAEETPHHEVNRHGARIMDVPNGNLLEGVLPRVLRRLVEQRRQVKKLLKEERQRAGKETVRAQQLDIRQLAIKLTANSLYGCLGFEGSRFFARPLAELVTSQGRETLQKTVDLARDGFNAQVIYGDTDSLFVYTGLEDISHVRRLGMELKRDVNKKYRTLEIEIDAIYKKMLLLKKKKYAALKVIDPTNPDNVVREVKGLDLVRHDWCDLSHDASEHFLTQIFQGQASNIDDAVGNVLTYLTDLANKVNLNELSLSKYVITRSLTKKPQDYPDAKSLPHVAVAMRLMSNDKKLLKAGDYIKYVICRLADGQEEDSHGAKGVAMRAYHPDEVIASEGKLVLDRQYYLEHQVLPPILRLCDPIESIEASRIAVSLGLDGRRYERKDNDDLDSNGNYLALGPQSASEKFHDCDPLMVPCKNCGMNHEFRGMLFKASGKALDSSGLECCKCNIRFSNSTLSNALTLTLRKWVGKYYTSPMQLNGDDGSRKREVRDIALGGNGSLARRKFDESWLYKQLRYARFLMDVESRWKSVSTEDKMPASMVDTALYDDLMKRVDKVFDANAYRFIDLAAFLAPLGIA